MIFTLCIFALDKHLLSFSSVFLMDHWIRWEGKFTILFISCYTLYLDDFFLSELLYIHVFVCFSAPILLSLNSQCSGRTVCVCLKSSVLCWNVPSGAVNYSSSRVVGADLLKVMWWMRWVVTTIVLEGTKNLPNHECRKLHLFFLMKECKESELMIILRPYKKAFLFLKLSVKCISSPCRHLRVVTSDVIEENSTE